MNFGLYLFSFIKMCAFFVKEKYAQLKSSLNEKNQPTEKQTNIVQRSSRSSLKSDAGAASAQMQQASTSVRT